MSILTQLSPGIQVNEIDLTGIVPAVSTSVGAFVGQFTWGPCDQPMLISDENELIKMFGKPSPSPTEAFAGQSFFSCASFLAYTNALYVVRSINDAKNASDTLSANANSTTTFSVTNELVFEETILYDSNTHNALFMAKYPGVLGNSIRVSMCSDSNSFSSWAYKNLFDNAPGTSAYIYDKTKNLYANDEVHIIVIDAKGEFTGKANTVMEKFAYLSKASDAVNVDGVICYYKEYLKNNSQYVYAVDNPSGANSWGLNASNVTKYESVPTYEVTLLGGSNGNTVTDSQLINNWYKFKNRDQYEISLAFIGSATPNVAKNVLDNVILGPESETPTRGRKDTILFISPRYSDVVNQPGYETYNIIDNSQNGFLNVLDRSSSYLVCDSGWKKMLDRYNNIYRWVPLNADIAGVCAYTDAVADPWYSPGGYNRGKLKNILSLAWSPDQTDRDQLYKNGINPVISQRGEGVILLGDKTMQAKPSAFDRINVRRLFIILEKAISRAARYTLFEFNDEFTRAQFVAMVEPYLRTVKGRRGIIDFKVICDTTNNTPDIIDRNGFVGDIYIKPSRSINFIQLNFIATKTGVEFSTVIGQW